MDNPIISVIVPVYNVEKYLSRCIDSILVQTFTNFELLLIDDGSKDNSGEICNRYAEKDNRVRVFHKKNGGVSSARNLGLLRSRGEWVCFIDSDDQIEYDYLLTYIETVNKYNVDCCITSYKFIYNNNVRGEKYVEDGLYYKKDICDLIVYLRNKSLFGIPWNKLFKLKIIKDNNLSFDEDISSYEDEIFVMQYLKYVNSVALNSQRTYIYSINDKLSLSKKYIEINQHLKINDLLYNLGLSFSDKKEYLNHLTIEYVRHLEESIFRLYWKYSNFNHTKRLMILKIIRDKAKSKGVYEILKNNLNNHYYYFFDCIFLFDFWCVIINTLKKIKYKINSCIK